MKLIVLAMLICLAFGGSSGTIGGSTGTPPTGGTNSTECYDHKLNTLYPIDQMIMGFTNFETEAMYLGSEFLYKFYGSTPKVATKEDLGVCSQFEGQLTCCNKNITLYFDYLAAQSVQGIMQQANPISRLATLATSALQTAICRGSTAYIEFDEIRSNPLLTKLNALEKSVNQTKIAFAKTLAKQNRGALCSICMGPKNVTDYLVDDLLSVKKAGVDSFLADQLAAFNSFVSTSENETKVNEVVDEIIDAYTGADTNCVKADIDELKAGVKKTYFGFSSSDKNSDNSLKCSGKTLYHENLACLYEFNGDVGIETYIPPTEPSGRFLESESTVVADDVVVSSTGGFDSYLDGEADSYITDDYFKIPFAEKFPRNYNQTIQEYFEQVVSSASIMTISLFAVVCVFFV